MKREDLKRLQKEVGEEYKIVTILGDEYRVIQRVTAASGWTINEKLLEFYREEFGDFSATLSEREKQQHIEEWFNIHGSTHKGKIALLDTFIIPVHPDTITIREMLEQVDLEDLPVEDFAVISEALDFFLLKLQDKKSESRKSESHLNGQVEVKKSPTKKVLKRQSTFQKST